MIRARLVGCAASGLWGRGIRGRFFSASGGVTRTKGDLWGAGLWGERLGLGEADLPRTAEGRGAIAIFRASAWGGWGRASIAEREETKEKKTKKKRGFHRTPRGVEVKEKLRILAGGVAEGVAARGDTSLVALTGGAVDEASAISAADADTTRGGGAGSGIAELTTDAGGIACEGEAGETLLATSGGVAGGAISTEGDGARERVGITIAEAILFDISAAMVGVGASGV